MRHCLQSHRLLQEQGPLPGKRSGRLGAESFRFDPYRLMTQNHGMGVRKWEAIPRNAVNTLNVVASLRGG